VSFCSGAVYTDALLSELCCAPSVVFRCYGRHNPDIYGTLLTTSEGKEAGRLLVREQDTRGKQCAHLHLAAILNATKQSLDRP